ncbi:MAG: hypothetical protein R3A45_03000 [Bdellovibrionota bacterium]
MIRHDHTSISSMMARRDDDFDPLADQTVTALVTDDSAGFTVTESGGSTSATEDTNTDSFMGCVRRKQPSSDVASMSAQVT